MSTDLSELKRTFKHLNILNVLSKKDVLQLMEESISNHSSKQKREFKLLLSEKFIPKKDMMQLIDASISNHSSKLAEQKREFELLLNEKFISKKDISQLMNETISNRSSKLAENVANLYVQQKWEFDEKFSSKVLNTRYYDEHLNCLKKCNATDELPKSCAETKAKNYFTDVIRALFIPKSNLQAFYVFCAYENIEEKAWTIIQRRDDGSENFNRNWSDYKRGFGDAYGEYWLGLERLHWMTKDQPHELWISLEDYDGEIRYAKYSNFSISNEKEGYKLTVNGYSGNAGDALKNHNNNKFATYDQDNEYGCAKNFSSGWWFGSCYFCNLNGIYRSFSTYNMVESVKWNSWRLKSLEYAHMAIRPV